MYPLLQEQCRAGMPQVMESAPWNPGLGQRAPIVLTQQVAGIQRLANFVGKDEVMVFPHWPQAEALSGLPFPMMAESATRPSTGTAQDA